MQQKSLGKEDRGPMMVQWCAVKSAIKVSFGVSKFWITTIDVKQKRRLLVFIKSLNSFVRM